MTAVLSPLAKQQFFNNNGRPLVGGKLFTYIAGTTTKQATYVDSAGITPNANPVILDYRGECNLWVPPNVRYKYVLAPSTDTDPPTHPIWTVDNLVESQLITLYGGVDSGSSNAYVLTFTANFSAYTDGIVIYWVVSNTNTTGSTLNVNGLGLVTILNQNGTGLAAGQLAAGQTVSVIYRAGAFYLLTSGQVSNFSSNATLVGVGFTTSPNFPIKYDINGHTATLFFPAVSATSNSTGFTLTGLPAALIPVQTQQVSIAGAVLDNSAVLVSGELKFTNGSSVVTVTKLGVAAAFTAANIKGFNLGFGVSYVLN